MEFTFLGTSSGVPTRYRNVSGLALRMEDSKSWYLIDCGEGTQHQLLHTRHSLVSLKAICITHVHGDHSFGLPGLLASASMAGRQDRLTIIGPRELEHFVTTALTTTDSRLSYGLEFVDVEQLERGWRGEDVLIERWPLSHRVPSYGYSISEAKVEHRLNREKLIADGIPPGPEWGELQHERSVRTADGRILNPENYLLRERGPRKIVVGGDNDTPSLLKAACENAQVLIHESTYSQAVADKVGPAPQHSSVSAVAKFANDVEIPHLILTHFSARYQGHTDSGEPAINELEREAQMCYRGNLHMASDFATFKLGKDRQLTRLNSDE